MYRYQETEERRIKKINEGRGTGAGAHYLAWIRPSEISSKGTESRQVEGRHRRPVFTLSDIETSFFNVADCRVDELYDQWPLDFEETQKIALELGIDHPRCTQTGSMLTMTTDFVLNVRRSSEVVDQVPVQCKHSQNLLDYNTAEHIEIERLYWHRRGLKLRIVTESAQCIPIAVRQNCEALMQHRFIHLQRTERNGNLTFDHRVQMLEQAVMAATAFATLNDVLHAAATEANTTVDAFTPVLFNLLYRRHFAFDMSKADLLRHDVLDIAERTRVARKKGGQ